MNSKHIMRRMQFLHTAVVILALGRMACVLDAQTLPAERAPSVAPVTGKLYRIAGTLTDSVTGKPVVGATMEMTTPQGLQVLQNSVTDSDGHFALGPVPAGKYSLRAYKRGYAPEGFNQHDSIYWSAIVTGEGQDTEHIPFHLDPEGIIRGQVTDDAGAPVRNAQVFVAHWTDTGGLGRHLEKSVVATVDDQGEFELWKLPPGRYLLAARAVPWFAVLPAASAPGYASSPEQQAAGAVLDVAYPVTYYDRTTDESSAATLSLARGETAVVNFSLHAVRAAHLILHMGPESEQYPGWPALMQTIFGQESDLGLPGQIKSPGSYEFSVAPGHYVAEGGRPPHRTDIDLAGSLDVNLAAGARAIQKNIRVQMADGSPVPQPLQLSLFSWPGMRQQIDGEVNENSEMYFPLLPQGEWNVGAQHTGAAGDDTALAVVGSQLGATTTNGSLIRLTDKQEDATGKEEDLTLIVAAGKTRIEGFATANGMGEAGVMIVLVPTDPEGNFGEFRRDQTDSDGSFTLPNVIPGEYIIVAIRGGWDLQWAETKTIAKYLPGGFAIVVPAKADPVITLQTQIRVQDK